MALWSKKAKSEPAPPPAAANGTGDTAPKPPAAPEGSGQASAADMQQREAASARLLFRLGEVVSVLMRAPQFRAMPLGDVQALVLPPLRSGQFLVAEARSKSQGFMGPVAIALWAKVSEEVDQRLSQSLDKPIKLAPDEWKSGEIAWLIVLAGNAQAIAPILKKFQETTLNGQPLKMRSKAKDGKTVVSTFRAVPGGA